MVSHHLFIIFCRLSLIMSSRTMSAAPTLYTTPTASLNLTEGKLFYLGTSKQHLPAAISFFYYSSQLTSNLNSLFLSSSTELTVLALRFTSNVRISTTLALTKSTTLSAKHSSANVWVKRESSPRLAQASTVSLPPLSALVKASNASSIWVLKIWNVKL